MIAHPSIGSLIFCLVLVHCVQIAVPTAPEEHGTHGIPPNDEVPQAERNKGLHITGYSHLQNILSGGGIQPEYDGPPQPILMIGAGLPRTGTASFQQAMGMLGFNCYHMLVVHKTTGHREMWRQYLAQKTIPFEDVMGGITAAGFNATVDAPTAFQYKRIMELYPDAKVVLTIRSEEDPQVAAQKWTKSTTSTIFRTVEIFSEIPWRWFGRFNQAKEFAAALWQDAGVPRKEPHLLPSYYQEWNDQVQKVVPAENLLVFRAQDGWKPLCEFLSPLSDVARENCERLLADKEPYPHVNDTAKVQSVMAFFTAITKLFKALPFVILFMALAAFIVVRGKRAKPLSKEKKNE